MVLRRTVKAGRGLKVAGEGARVQACIVCSYTITDGQEEVELERREGVELTLGEGVEPLSLLLEDTLATMREGEVVQIESVPRHILPDDNLLNLPPPPPPPPPPISITYTMTLISFTRCRQVWEMETSELISRAKRCKERGGELFRTGNERPAALCYSKAAKMVSVVGAEEDSEVEEMRVVLGLNLAACQLKLGLYSHVISNCNRVLDRQPQNVKALYRRGCASMKMEDTEEAERDLQEAASLEPKNSAVLRKLRELSQQKQRDSVKLRNALKPMFTHHT